MNTPNDEREREVGFGEAAGSQPPAEQNVGQTPQPGATGWTAPPPPGAAAPPDPAAGPHRSGPHPSGPQAAGGYSSGPQAPLGWSGRDPRRKSPLLAVLLSMMPGLGQVYVGNYRRGFTNILVVAALITLLANDLGPLAPLAGLGLAFFWLYNMIDAGRRASHYNMMLSAAAGGPYPDDIDFQNAPGGSRAGGIIMIVVGFLFLMNTRYRWDFEWIEEWWPLGFILLGAYLVWKDAQARRERESEERARKLDTNVEDL